MQATGPVLKDQSAVRPALGYTVQPVHVAQSTAIPHHTPHTNTTHHTPLRCCPDHSSSSDSSSWSESSSTMKSHLRAPRGKEK